MFRQGPSRQFRPARMRQDRAAARTNEGVLDARRTARGGSARAGSFSGRRLYLGSPTMGMADRAAMRARTDGCGL